MLNLLVIDLPLCRTSTDLFAGDDTVHTNRIFAILGSHVVKGSGFERQTVKVGLGAIAS